MSFFGALPPADITPMGYPLVSPELVRQAGGSEQLANRMFFLADLEIELLVDPDNATLAELRSMVEEDTEYLQVAISIGRVAL